MTPLFPSVPSVRYSTEGIIQALNQYPEKFAGHYTAPALSPALHKVYKDILGNEKKVVLLQKMNNGHGHSITLKATDEKDTFVLSSRDHEPKKIRKDGRFLKCDTHAMVDASGTPKPVGAIPLVKEHSTFGNATISSVNSYEPVVKFETAKGYQALLRNDISFNELLMPTAHLYQFLQGKGVYDIPAEVYIGKTGKKHTRMVALNTKRDVYSLPKPMFKALEQASKLFSRLEPGKFIQR
jgi:hypothetical protein